MHTKQILGLLRDRHQPPDYAWATEVRTDDQHVRYADAVAFDLRPRMPLLHAYEIKISRGDWLHELRDPSKSQAARVLVDYWWVVAPPGVVRPKELPPGAGYLEARDTGLAQMVAARYLTTGMDRLDRGFMATFLRRVDPLEPRAYWEAKVREAEFKAYRRHVNQRHRLETHARLQGRVTPPTAPEGEDFCP